MYGVNYMVDPRDAEEKVAFFRSGVVRTRKPHQCCVCRQTIEAGERARSETVMLRGEGRPTTYYYHGNCS